MIRQLESMDPDVKDAVALKEYYVVAPRKLNFETKDEDNDNAKLATSQGHNKNAVDEDQSATSKEVDCSGLLKTPSPRIIKKQRNSPSLSSSVLTTRGGANDEPRYTGLSGSMADRAFVNIVQNPKQWPRCHWAFGEKCYLERFHPSPCHHPGCYNYAHTRCILEYCHHNSIEYDDPLSIGVFCREHFPGYCGIIHPLDETYNVPPHAKTNAKPKKFKSAAHAHTTFEPCVCDMTSNGLWLAPDCADCFRTDKYKDIGNKACKHPWIEERLNMTGQYIMFGSSVYHRGYFNNLRGAVTVTAQLFCIPSTNHDLDTSTRTSRERDPITGATVRIGKGEFVPGMIPKEDIQDLTEVLVHEDGWEEMLGYKEYNPAPTRFQGVPINSDSNKQIDQIHFDKLPQIKKHVKMFEDKFPDITVFQVWLIQKSGTESGFQAWHQDKVGLQTKTIVVNLGSASGDTEMNYQPEFGEDSNCIDLEPGHYLGQETSYYSVVTDGGKLKRFVSYEQRVARVVLPPDPSDPEEYEYDTQKKAGPPGEAVTVHSSSSESEEEDDNTDVSICSEVRDKAIQVRQRRQANQAVKHIKYAGKEALKNGVGIGAIVSLYVDYRVHSHSSGLLGICVC